MWERLSRRDLARRALGGLARAHAPRLRKGTARAFGVPGYGGRWVLLPCARSGFVPLLRLGGGPGGETAWLARGLVSARGHGPGGGARGRCAARVRDGWAREAKAFGLPAAFADPSPRAGWTNRGGSRIREGPLARCGRGSHGRRGPGSWRRCRRRRPRFPRGSGLRLATWAEGRSLLTIVITFGDFNTFQPSSILTCGTTCAEIESHGCGPAWRAASW